MHASKATCAYQIVQYPGITCEAQDSGMNIRGITQTQSYILPYMFTQHVVLQYPTQLNSGQVLVTFESKSIKTT